MRLYAGSSGQFVEDTVLNQIAGKGQAHAENAVIVELKQWDKCGTADGENEVVTFVGGANREVLHPSAQVGRYRMYLSDTHTAFHEGENHVSLAGCAYLHNYPHDPDDILYDPKFESVLSSDPIFTMDAAPDLMGYIQERLSAGQGMEVLKRAEESRYRPSRKLMDHVGQVINGNSQYVLLDEQVVEYDKGRALAT